MPARPMPLSPNKKRRAGRLPSSITFVASVGNSKKETPACWPFKKSVSSNHGGNSNKKAGRRVTIHGDGRAGFGIRKGSRVVVVNRVPDAPPGRPQGKCLGDDKGERCRCGKHNKRR